MLQWIYAPCIPLDLVTRVILPLRRKSGEIDVTQGLSTAFFTRVFQQFVAQYSLALDLPR
jgi:hypothetical protein